MTRVTKAALVVCILVVGVRVTLLDAALDGLCAVAWISGLVALIGWIRGGSDA